MKFFQSKQFNFIFIFHPKLIHTVCYIIHRIFAFHNFSRIPGWALDVIKLISAFNDTIKTHGDHVTISVAIWSSKLIVAVVC